MWRSQAFKAGRSHNSAFTLGGPLHIPKLVDGRGKAFFFANYSYVNDSIPGRNQGNNTVPANEKHLQGDFSDMLRLPNPNQYIIYDPLTARPDPANPNRVIRTPFPNNVIPRDRIFNPDGTYKNKLFGLYAAAVPKANQNFVEQGQQPTGNYFRGAEPSIPVSHLFGLRFDYNLSSADRLFLRGSGSRYHEDVDDWTFESPTPEFRGLHDSDRDRYTWSYTGNWTRTFGQTVLDTQLSANKFYTLDKQQRADEIQADRFRSAELSGPVLRLEGRLPDAAREHRRVISSCRGTSIAKATRRRTFRGSSTRRRCEARTRCAAESTCGRRCAAASAAAMPRGC